MSDPADSARRRVLAPRRKLTVSLTAAQAGKLRVLWQEHSGPLHALLVGWCRDVQNASDILQETFRRLAASPAIMDKMDNPRAFLAVSARRIAVDFARRSTTRTAYQTAAGAEMPAVENPGPTDETLRAAITEALASLPPEQRLVVEHKMMKGRTLDDIAKLENISLNTAASRLRYALDKIRSHLRPYYDDLNRKDFKLMKNDLPNDEQAVSQRIITPLQPKRVPSVAPGLEGLAAMAPDACEAAPEIMAPEPEFLVAAGETPTGELPEPSIAFCGLGGNAWEGNLPEPVELPENFFVTLFEGEDETVVVGAGDGESADGAASHDGEPEPMTFEMLSVDSTDGAAPEFVDSTVDVTWETSNVSPEDLMITLFDGEFDHQGAEGDAVPFDWYSGFEVCVLPVPEQLAVGMEPNDSTGTGPVDGHDLVTDDSSDFDGAIVHTGGEVVSSEDPSDGAGLAEGTSLTLGGSGEFTHGTIISGEGAPTKGDADAHNSDDSALHSGNLFLDGRNTVVEIQPFWRSNGGAQPEIAYSMTGAPGLSLGGSGDFAGETAVSGAQVHEVGHSMHDDVAHNGAGPISPVESLATSGKSDFAGVTAVRGGEMVLGEHTGVSHADDNALTLSNGSSVLLQGGRVVSGENVYAFNHAEAHAVSLPLEIAMESAPAATEAHSFGDVAAGLAPTPGAALIVEFNVLSPSEQLQSHATESHADQSVAHSVEIDVPHLAAADAGHARADVDSHHDVSVSDASSEPPQHFAAAGRHEVSPAAQVAHKVDAPTAAAGAVAAGTVVQAGGVAPSVRRPLPKI